MSAALSTSVLLLALATPAAEAPHFVLPNGVESFPLRATRTDVNVAGVIAHVRVRQRYENDGSQPIEAQYVFAGSTRAAVFAMTMKIGDRTIVAKIDERARARRRYETAKDEGRAAALLEQSRPNVFSMNVANILPGDVVEVELDYTEMLVPEGGVYELVVPGVVGTRFDGEGGRAAWNENPHLPDAARAPTFGLTARVVGGAPVRAVSSPSHTIAPHFTGRDTVDVAVLDADGADRDFILRYRLDADAIQTGVLLFEGGGEKFFAATMQPPERVEPATIPAREYVFIVDVSGSMSGFPLQVSVELIERMLRDLRPEDRFNIVLFAGDRTVFAERSVAATPGEIERAVEVVRHLRSGGGTELLAALETALALPRDDAYATSFVIVTDGYVNVEHQAYALIRRERKNANVFAFGIGRSVNRHLIETLASAGAGRPFVVTEPSEAVAAATTFERYVKTPLLTGVTLEAEGFDAYDVSAPADLFGERPIVVFGKYRGAAKGALTFRGRTGQGAYTKTIALEDATASDDLVALKYLWARDRVAALTEGDTEENAEEVTALGLRYGLMTPFTSFVAEDRDVRRHGGAPVTVRQPLPGPSGVRGGVFGGGGLGTGVNNAVGGLGSKGTGSGGGGYGGIELGGSGPGLGRVSSGMPVVMGSLSKDVIRRGIRRHQAAFRHAFESALKSDPNVAGKVTLEFVIGSDGRVERVRIIGDDATKKVWDGLIAVAKRMKFPPPTGGGIIIVRYPLIFRATP